MTEAERELVEAALTHGPERGRNDAYFEARRKSEVLYPIDATRVEAINRKVIEEIPK